MTREAAFALLDELRSHRIHAAVTLQYQELVVTPDYEVVMDPRQAVNVTELAGALHLRGYTLLWDGEHWRFTPPPVLIDAAEEEVDPVPQFGTVTFRIG